MANKPASTNSSSLADLRPRQCAKYMIISCYTPLLDTERVVDNILLMKKIMICVTLCPVALRSWRPFTRTGRAKRVGRQDSNQLYSTESRQKNSKQLMENDGRFGCMSDEEKGTAHHRVTFPAGPRSRVPDSTPSARNTRRIERRDMSSPLSSLET